MNYHHILNYNIPFAAGWTSSDFLLDPFAYNYLESVWQCDKNLPVSAAGSYTTDVLAEKAFSYIEEGALSDSPFFLTIAPIAPHANVVAGLSASESAPFEFTSGHQTPADRHKSLFQDLVVPGTLNFNPDVVC
jgi:hypothetical protein